MIQWRFETNLNLISFGSRFTGHDVVTSDSWLVLGDSVLIARDIRYFI